MFGSYTLSITSQLVMPFKDKRIVGAQLVKKATREVTLTIKHRKDQFISNQQTEQTNPWGNAKKPRVSARRSFIGSFNFVWMNASEARCNARIRVTASQTQTVMRLCFLYKSNESTQVALYWVHLAFSFQNSEHLLNPDTYSLTFSPSWMYLRHRGPNSSEAFSHV